MTPLLAQMHAEHRARLMRLGCIPAPPAPKPPPRIIERPKRSSSPPSPPAPKPMLPSAEELINLPRTVKRATIIRHIVARDYDLTVEQILAHDRRVARVFPRHLAIYLVYHANPYWSTTQLGRFFHRDHTTVMHASSKIAEERAADPRMDSILIRLECLIIRATENVNGTS